MICDLDEVIGCSLFEGFLSDRCGEVCRAPRVFQPDSVLIVKYFTWINKMARREADQPCSVFFLF